MLFFFFKKKLKIRNNNCEFTVVNLIHTYCKKVNQLCAKNPALSIQMSVLQGMVSLVKPFFLLKHLSLYSELELQCSMLTCVVHYLMGASLMLTSVLSVHN